LLSMHTAKGLEFPCVGVGGLGAVGRHGEETENCVRSVYMAVTRATHEVMLTYSQESDGAARPAARLGRSILNG
jgi:DNA helicase IV